jgi:excisionase family DNA binding protein
LVGRPIKAMRDTNATFGGTQVNEIAASGASSNRSGEGVVVPPDKLDVRDAALHKLLTVHDVAKLLQLKVSTVYKMSSSKEIPFLKVRGSLRFDIDDLKSWMQSRKVKPIR